MKVQSVKTANFRTNKPVKLINLRRPQKTSEDLRFEKGAGKIMRRAFIFSAVMLTGVLIYFKRKF